MLSIKKKLLNYQQPILRVDNEILWSLIWHDTVRDIGWVKDMPGISPGRSAVGYNYLYVMTRVLNECRPENVLDIGLGMSSVLISSYYRNYNNGNHTIIEHDESWIDFFGKNHELSKQSKICKQELVEKRIDNEGYPAYNNLEKTLNGKIKYSVISIDAPYGGDSYSRRDIIELLPNIIEVSGFVIILDDANRKGEKRTVEDIKKVFKKMDIPVYTGNYIGATDCCVIVSKNNKYICTL